MKGRKEGRKEGETEGKKDEERKEKGNGREKGVADETEAQNPPTTVCVHARH